MDCPYRFATECPDDDTEQRQDPYRCAGCGQQVRHCAACATRNRTLARFCRHCGAALMPLPDEDYRLCSPGEVAEAVEEPQRFPLEKILGLGNDSRADLWLAHDDGLFVIATQIDRQDAPVSLYFLHQMMFRHGAARVLASSLPGIDRWLDLPLVVGQGLFLATDDAIDFFPSHGADDLFQHIRWQPQAGERLLALAEDDQTGLIVLLLRNATGEMQIATGNSQSRHWDDRLSIAYTSTARGYEIGFLPGNSSQLWLYDGETFLQFDFPGNAGTLRPLKQRTLPAGYPPPPTAKARTRLDYFKPFVIRPTASAATLVYPRKTETGDNIVPAICQLNNPEANGVAVSAPHGSWVMPHGRCESFFCGTVSGLLAFQANAAPQTIEKAKLVEHGLLTGKRWMIAVSEFQEAGQAAAGPPQPILHTYQIERSGSTCTIKGVRQANLPLRGEVPRGMPPFRRGDSIFIPIRQGKRANVRTTVYQIQLLRV